MKSTQLAFLTFLAIATLSFTNQFMNAADSEEKPNSQQPLLRHVVLFQFKATASEQQVQEIVAAFGQLPKKISQIHSYEWGTNNSPEGLANGFTHCFFVTFASEADRDAYLPHPEHQKFVSLLKPQLEKVLVVDYWTGK